MQLCTYIRLYQLFEVINYSPCACYLSPLFVMLALFLMCMELSEPHSRNNNLASWPQVLVLSLSHVAYKFSLNNAALYIALTIETCQQTVI